LLDVKIELKEQAPVMIPPMPPKKVFVPKQQLEVLEEEPEDPSLSDSKKRLFGEESKKKN